MRKIKIPVGETVHLDGGPFVNFYGREAQGETIYGEDQTGEVAFDLDDIEDWVAGEMESNEPVKLSTGDVSRIVGHVRLPLCVGYIVEVDDLDGEWESLANLANHQRKRMFERALENKGGTIESV